MTAPHTELAATMPWTVAKPEADALRAAMDELPVLSEAQLDELAGILASMRTERLRRERAVA